jgi:hypothetical protein
MGTQPLPVTSCICHHILANAAGPKQRGQATDSLSQKKPFLLFSVSGSQSKQGKAEPHKALCSD